jgi:flagellar M-ring protein FliF
VEALNQLFRGIGMARLAAMVGVAAALFGFFVFLSTRIASTDMGLLYGELDVNDSGQIVAKLESMGVPVELRANGTQILVPRDQVLRLRMSMAQEGLPRGGSIGYEIFDRSQSFGTANFVQKINHLRALEGELSRTIGSLDQVNGARVHLVLPQRELFSRGEREPSASIVLRMRGSYRLDRAQVLAIQHLAAAAVPGLKPSRISVIDESGALLARGIADGAENEQAATTLHEYRQSYEGRLRQAVETLLERSVGIGKVRAEVAAEMDLDRVTLNSEIYDPDGQVVRSTQTVEEEEKATETDGDEAVTVADNLPDAEQAALGGAASLTQNTRTQETVNYEISKTIKTQIHETGTVKRLSVAILVDGTYTKGADGSVEYAPRSDEELQQLARLARVAIGYDEARGDSVEVVNLRFAPADSSVDVEASDGFLGFSKEDLLQIVEVLVLGLVAILVLLLVVRPLVSRAMTMSAPARESTESEAAQIAAATTAALAAPSSSEAADELDEAESGIESMIDMDRVEGRVRASSIKKISDIVEKHPEEAIAILRQWMYSDA